MATSGQFLSRTGQARLRPFEQAPRPMAGYAHDYAPGHETGLHRHPRAQLLFATAGVMRVETEAALFTVPPGTGLWVPADTLHARPDGRRGADARAVPARGRRRIGPGVDHGDRGLAAVAGTDPDGMRRAGGVGRAGADPAGRRAGAARDRASRNTAAWPCRPAAIRGWSRVAAALVADPADPRDLDDYAAIAGASVRTLARLFRAETGMSFQQWRRQLRMTEALAQIAHGVPPARVARSVGYASVPAFGAAFRETFGTTPAMAAPRPRWRPFAETAAA